MIITVSNQGKILNKKFYYNYINACYNISINITTDMPRLYIVLHNRAYEIYSTKNYWSYI